eukprot:Gregarina_sp_Poly_1__4364@NODE_2360_length_2238_cov_52_156610_g1503_i0_p1_GENE_NODE_2360_length_2238_cov_52_156610_g1503_i0NODE_2360_length_2238_cov_52_156610_g1503_i0_p1_ORF_typecomplete_len303_score35_17_NODE_2360_length_2238_cov_52_156610_g1503_i07181626
MWQKLLCLVEGYNFWARPMSDKWSERLQEGFVKRELSDPSEKLEETPETNILESHRVDFGHNEEHALTIGPLLTSPKFDAISPEATTHVTQMEAHAAHSAVPQVPISPSHRVQARHSRSARISTQNDHDAKLSVLAETVPKRSAPPQAPMQKTPLDARNHYCLNPTINVNTRAWDSSPAAADFVLVEKSDMRFWQWFGGVGAFSGLAAVLALAVVAWKMRRDKKMQIHTSQTVVGNGEQSDHHHEIIHHISCSHSPQFLVDREDKRQATPAPPLPREIPENSRETRQRESRRQFVRRPVWRV